jgi:hypothetical protein
MGGAGGAILTEAFWELVALLPELSDASWGIFFRRSRPIR